MQRHCIYLSVYHMGGVVFITFLIYNILNQSGQKMKVQDVCVFEREIAYIAFLNIYDMLHHPHQSRRECNECIFFLPLTPCRKLMYELVEARQQQWDRLCAICSPNWTGTRRSSPASPSPFRRTWRRSWLSGTPPGHLQQLPMQMPMSRPPLLQVPQTGRTGMEEEAVVAAAVVVDDNRTLTPVETRPENQEEDMSKSDSPRTFI